MSRKHERGALVAQSVGGKEDSSQQQWRNSKARVSIDNSTEPLVTRLETRACIRL